jgi:hypothetical protein
MHWVAIAGLGLTVLTNVAAVCALLWKGGRWVERVEGAIDRVKGELNRITNDHEDHENRLRELERAR